MVGSRTPENQVRGFSQGCTAVLPGGVGGILLRAGTQDGGALGRKQEGGGGGAVLGVGGQLEEATFGSVGPEVYGVQTSVCRELM